MHVLRECVDRLGPQVVLGRERRGTLFYLYLPWQARVGHRYFYYFRHLDEWQKQRGGHEGLLYFRLFVTGHQAPTLIHGEEFLSFMERAPGEEVQRLAGEVASWLREIGLAVQLPDPGALEAPRIVRMRSPQLTLLLLPGPFSVCADPALAAGGLRFVPQPPPPS